MNSKSRFALPKSHRLRSTLLIQHLFKSGSSNKEFPLLAHYFWSTEVENHQFMPIVSKRRFRKAVDRNRIKRQLKEIWRLNQHRIECSDSRYLVIGFVYLANRKLTYSQIEEAGLSIISQINNEIAQTA